MENIANNQVPINIEMVNSIPSDEVNKLNDMLNEHRRGIEKEIDDRTEKAGTAFENYKKQTNQRLKKQNTETNKKLKKQNREANRKLRAVNEQLQLLQAQQLEFANRQTDFDKRQTSFDDRQNNQDARLTELEKEVKKWRDEVIKTAEKDRARIDAENRKNNKITNLKEMAEMPPELYKGEDDVIRALFCDPDYKIKNEKKTDGKNGDKGEKKDEKKLQYEGMDDFEKSIKNVQNKCLSQMIDHAMETALVAVTFN